jgi:hypothetical protein
MYIHHMRKLRKKPVQMYLEPRQDAALAVLAGKRGVSKAELIRESIEKYITAIPVEDDPALGVIGLGNSGKRDLSGKHDQYVATYAARRKK